MLHAAALFYFREVARAGSIRKAAASLNVAASALNRQILKLEADLGTRLFDRLAGGMRITTAGDLLLQHVNGTLLDFERVRAAIDDMKAARSGHVTIAAVDSLLVDFLPRAIDRFRAEFPAVTYTVIAIDPPEVIARIASGEVDIGFTFVGENPPQVKWIADVPAAIGAVMRADHPLAARQSITFAEAARYPILKQLGPLSKGADIDAAFAAFTGALKPVMQSNSIQMLKLSLMLGLGVSFFTRFGFLHEIEKNELVWRPLDSPSINTVRLGMVIAANRAPTPAAEQLTRWLGDELRKLAARPGAA